MMALTAIVMLSASATPAAPLRIVILGDSLVAGYNLKPAQAFPESLERRLNASGRDVVIVNAGVSGDDATGGFARMDWSIPEDTQLVIVELGANDMLRGNDPDKTKATLDKIFTRVKSRGMGLVIAGMRSIDNWGPEYRQKFDAIYPALAQKHGVPLFPFFMDNIFGQNELLLSDKLHPNPDGVVKMVDQFLPFIEPVIDAFPRGAKPAG